MQLELSYGSVLCPQRGRCLHVVANWSDGGHYVANEFWMTHATLTALSVDGCPWSIFDLIHVVIRDDAPTARRMLAALPLGLMFSPAHGLH